MPGKIENGLIHTGAADGNTVDIERETVNQIEPASAQFNDITRFRENQGFLKPFLRICARGDSDRFCECRGAQAKRGGNQ